MMAQCATHTLAHYVCTPDDNADFHIQNLPFFATMHPSSHVRDRPSQFIRLQSAETRNPLYKNEEQPRCHNGFAAGSLPPLK